jgi:DUF4097 and DUF4098 domain-containing protein YvlB
MKSILITLNIMMMFVTACIAQDFTDKITKEFSFEKKTNDNALMVANINGNIKVTGYDGDKIQVEVTRTIKGKTQARLEKGKAEVKLGSIDRADTLILFVEEGCNTFGKKTNHLHHHNKDEDDDDDDNDKDWSGNAWGYNWDCNNNHCRSEYDYTMDFIIKVPAGIHLMVSTVNDGNIMVENVKGVVNADNINGSIKLSNLMREADASTINGDVDIEYAKNPVKDCRFYSLNGDINAWFQKGLTASLSFESFNGSFFTNIDRIEALPVKVEKSNHGEGIKYKVNGNRYQVGSGGAFLDFETFNGNVYLKEKTN